MRGLELSRSFYSDAVRPIMERRFPDVQHAAALLGPGSEVLGYDDDRSTDHHWGPRLQLFVSERTAAPPVHEALRHELPTSFAGFSTHFGSPVDPSGSRLLVPVEHGPVDHLVEVTTLADFLVERIGIDPREGLSAADWLVTPSQRLLELTAGDVFADPSGELARLRSLLSWYPHDVWLLVMAALWRRLAQLEHLHGRAGSRGDELGSRVIGASLVRDLMRLALVQERRYPPYAKWLGTAYAELDRRERRAVSDVLATGEWRERDRALAGAYRAVAAAHNALRVTEPVDPEPRQFYGRPFSVLFADRFADALRDAIRDPEVRAIDHQAGPVDAVSDNVDVLTRPWLWRRLEGLYDRTQSDEGERDDGR